MNEQELMNVYQKFSHEHSLVLNEITKINENSLNEIFLQKEITILNNILISI